MIFLDKVGVCGYDMPAFRVKKESENTKICVCLRIYNRGISR